MNKSIPFLDLKAIDAPYIDEIKDAIYRVIDSGRYIGGPVVEQFEQNLAQITNAEYAVGVSNGLDALRLSLRAAIELGYIHSGDGIIVPANTYIASILAVTDNNLQPILVEPDIHTYNLDSNLIDDAINEAAVQGINVTAIMPVHLYGRACWDQTLVEAINRHHLFVIEDNAQAIGAKTDTPGIFGTTATGSLGHIGAFSFYPTKNIGAIGDAGAIVTHDRELAQMVRTLANYGSDRRYHNIVCGYNCRLDTIQAAILNVKLQYLDRITTQRRHNADTLTRILRNCSTIICPETPQYAPSHVWHQYIIRVTTDHSDNNALGQQRDRVRQQLLEAGVSTDIHYATPPHRQPCYANNIPHKPLPITEMLSDSIISLPVAATLSEDQIRHYIADTINN